MSCTNRNDRSHKLELLEPRQMLAQTAYGGSALVNGRYEAERFDNGGANVAYYDTTSANLGRAARTDTSVDVQKGGSGGLNVGYVRAGEWLEYTIKLADAGTYRFDLVFASGSTGGKVHLEVDGVNKTGSLTLGNTGGWESWKTYSKSGVAIAGGTHVLRLKVDSSASGGDIGNFDYFKLTKTSSTTSGGSTGGGTSSGTTFAPKPLNWKSVASNPIRREESQSLVYNGKLYQVGGYVENFQATRRVDRYDLSTNKWTRLRDMPSGFNVTHAAVAKDPNGRDFWFVGGFIGSFTYDGHDHAHGPPATNLVYKYNASADTWTKAVSLPAARGGGGAGIIDGKLYYFGGSNKSRTADVSETMMLDLSNQGAGWKKVADFPSPRNHLGGIVVGGKLYAVGGQKGLEDQSRSVSTVQRFDPATRKWSSVASMPVALSHFNAATVLYDRYIITVGGENPHNTPRGYVFAYDTVLNKWAKMTSLPGARRAGVAGIIGNTLIQSTGFNSSHDHTSTTWKADLSSAFA